MVRVFAVLWLLLVAAPLVAQETGKVADLQSPIGGWVDHGLNHANDQYRAAYPKPPVDRGEQRGRTLIEGRLRRAMDERHPPTLVIDGSPVPLYADKDGRFARPWAFGRGSNSVELVDTDGARQRVQFYEADATKTQAKLRAILSWNDAHAQIDLHVITPVGHHAYFGDPVLPEGGGLDVDSVDGSGPIIFSSAAPAPGTWLFYANYWGNFDASGYDFAPHGRQRDVITARLTLVFNENTVNERRETYTVPMRKVGDLTLIRAVHL